MKQLDEKEFIGRDSVILPKLHSMWNTTSLWFEISIVTLLFLLGNIFLGHFEERSPAWRKLVKYMVTLVIVLTISICIGRSVALTLLGLALLPVIYVHGILLPKKGINGWTAEPKSVYYDFRGWDKNIFGDPKKDSLKEEHREILNLISTYLENNPSQRFGQALFNLRINEFNNNANPEKNAYALRDIYNDQDSDILERIKTQFKKTKNSSL